MLWSPLGTHSGHSAQDVAIDASDPWIHLAIILDKNLWTEETEHLYIFAFRFGDSILAWVQYFPTSLLFRRKNKKSTTKKRPNSNSNFKHLCSGAM